MPNYESNKNMEEIVIIEEDGDNKKEKEYSDTIFKFCDEDNSK